MNKLLIFSCIFSCYIFDVYGFCVGISGHKLVSGSSKGKSLQESMKKFEEQHIVRLDGMQKLVQEKENKLFTQRNFLKEKSDILEKKRLETEDKSLLEGEEQALHQLVDDFEKEYQDFVELEKDFKHKLQESKHAIKQKQYSELAAFDKDVVQRFAPLNDWDIVFAQESKHVMYLGKNVDKTEGVLASLNQQKTAQKKTYSTKEERRELFKDLGLVYLDEIKIDSGLKGDINGYYTSFYDDNKTNLDTNTSTYLSFVKKRYCAPISVQWVSDKVGFGVFATEDIHRGDFIQEYTGILRAAELRGGLVVDDTSYAWVYPSVAEYQNNLLVDSKYEGNEMRFVNHGNHPNVMQIKLLDEDGIFHICYVAREDIKAGEQVLISYGVDYWATREFFEDL